MGFRVEKLVLVCVLCALILAACSRAPEGGVGSKAAPEPQAAAAPAPARPAAATVDAAVNAELRRVVKKAALTLEVAVPGDALAATTRIVEGEGGFVAGTERRAATEDGKEEQGPVTLTLRVPAARFSATLEALRRLGKGDGSETVTTEDVSEEFIDLEARIKNQRELEAQFLQILKQATKVEEALNVQRELAAVRTEIDRMQGRHNFLQRETSLSTIRLTLVTPRPFVRASLADFTLAVARAASDTVNLSASIVTGTIRLLGVLLPLAFLLGLPLVLGLRLVRARAQRAASATRARVTT
jgi:hypothetical protein